jgi:flagellar biosynthesis component FlhA
MAPFPLPATLIAAALILPVDPLPMDSRLWVHFALSAVVLICAGACFRSHDLRPLILMLFATTVARVMVSIGGANAGTDLTALHSLSKSHLSNAFTILHGEIYQAFGTVMLTVVTGVLFLHASQAISQLAAARHPLHPGTRRPNELRHLPLSRRRKLTLEGMLKLDIMVVLLTLIATVVSALLSHDAGLSKDSPIHQYTALAMCIAVLSLLPLLTMANIRNRHSSSNRRRRYQATQMKQDGLAICGVSALALIAGALAPEPAALLISASMGLALTSHRIRHRTAIAACETNTATTPKPPGKLHTRDPREAHKPENSALVLEAHPRLFAQLGVLSAMDFRTSLEALRGRLGRQLGFTVPRVHLRPEATLKPGHYRLIVDGREAGGGELYPEMLLAITTRTGLEPIKGLPVIEHAFGMPGIWIEQSQSDDGLAKGYTVVTPIDVLCMHLERLTFQSSHFLLDEATARTLRQDALRRHPELSSLVCRLDATRELLLPLLRLLAEERVRLTDIGPVLTILAQSHPRDVTPVELLPQARSALKSEIIRGSLGNAQQVRAVLIHPELEGWLASEQTLPPREPPPPSSLREDFLSETLAAIDELAANDEPALIITTPQARLATSRIVRRLRPEAIVLAAGELANDIHVVKHRIVSCGLDYLNLGRAAHPDPHFDHRGPGPDQTSDDLLIQKHQEGPSAHPEKRPAHQEAPTGPTTFHSFTADNVADAMRLVRRTLGSEALIWSTHETTHGIEIIAMDSDAGMTGESCTPQASR